MFWKKIKYFLRRKKALHEVSSLSDLKLLENEFQKEKLFCVDTEFDWRTTYIPKLSLIQIGFRDKIFLIDCLNVNPRDFLRFPLESKEFLKIFHAVRSDATVIKNCLNINSYNVFDVQVAESFLNDGSIVGYGSIVQKYTSLSLHKSETNSNWLKRPLTENQIRYAFEDVDYLIDIYFSQRKKLLEKGLLDKVLKLSIDEANLGNESLKKQRIEKKMKKFSRRKIDIFIWREEIAESKNVPPAFIFNDKNIKILSAINTNDLSARKKVMHIIGDTLLTDDFMAKFS